MKIYIATALLLLNFTAARAQSFQLDLSAPQYNSGTAYLVYYYGKNMNVVDSATLNERGEAKFKSSKPVSPGVYAIVFPQKRWSYDFLIGEEQHIQVVAADTANLAMSSVISGSKENNLFRDYQRFVAVKGSAMEKEREAFQRSATREDSLRHQENYATLNRQLSAHRDSIVLNHPGSLLATMLRAMKEPTIIHHSPKTKQDSLENYTYYKQHYWDGVTFTDHRIIRTPFFIPKLERYFRQIVDQNADSIIREADYLLLLSRTNEPMYQFLLNWFTNEYFEPKVMGQDKVFVHLFEKYHSKGVSSWLNEQQQKAISDRAYMVMSNLIGEAAPPLAMTGISGGESHLYNITAPFTVIAFWDPNCGHCRTEMPLLDSLYRANWKKLGVNIFAVLTDAGARDKWKSFIEEHNLQDWQHVYESDAQQKNTAAAGKPSYKQLYDVIQTPTLYLLDENKRIIAKKLTPRQLDELIKAKAKQPTGE